MVLAVIILGGIGLVFGMGLAMAGQKFVVHMDPKQEEIMKILPGANCGACGFAGCLGYTEALVKSKSDTNKCPVGGFKVAHEIARILGVEIQVKEVEVAAILCRGNRTECANKYQYDGILDCRAAVVLAGGDKGCIYGCLGLGSCVKICPFDAIEWRPGEIPVININKCTGCGLCFKTCPKNIIGLIPRKNAVCIACKSFDKGKEIRAVCKVGCIACSACVKVCPVQAITLVNNLAIIDYSKCTGCGKCVEKCPTKTIVWIKKPQDFKK